MADPLAKIFEKIEEQGESLSTMLPKHIPVDKFLRTLKTAIRLDPNIAKADLTSLLGAAMKAAQDGLMIDGREAAITVYRQKVRGANGDTYMERAQYIPMYQGILKKMRNSGEIASIEAGVVYQKDEFDYERGDNARLIHRPSFDGDPGPIRLAYAIAKLKDGTVVREVMTLSELKKVRSCAKGGDNASSPWVKWEAEMYKKSVIRRISKLLPSSSDIDTLFEHDNEGYRLNPDHVENTPAKKAGGGAAALAKAKEEAPPEDDIPIADDEVPFDDDTGEVYDDDPV